ncbi:unnamed protein product [Victoria cruziana]
MAGNAKEFPIFNGNNYDSWRIRMRAYLKSQGLWDLVEGDSSKGEGVEAKEMAMKDGKALSIILEAIPESVVPCLEDAMTSKEAWTILNQKYRPDKKENKRSQTQAGPTPLESKKKLKLRVEDIDAGAAPKENVTRESVSQPSDNQNMEEMGGSTEAGEEVETLPITGGSEFQVFLSFRGDDTRKGFTSHLYDDLVGRGISTFMDSEKLEKGERIDKLFEYIERSKIIVVIFSERYAESRWCLKEVARSVECKKQIIPVFFGVEPSDVRKLEGTFGSEFRKHETNREQNQEDVRKWREALEKVGNISGFTLKHGKEAELRREIVKLLWTKASGKTFEVAKHPIGLKTRVEDVKKIIGKCGDQVHMIGIDGMGGLGKTTIAMAVYNDLAKGFDSAACFLSNIRENCKQPNGLVTLQKQVLQEIFKVGNICFDNVARGQCLIKEKAKNRKVLLVLDDVDSVEQLDALAGGRDWFGSGSVIIITTRNREVLLTHEVKEEEIYKPQMLNKAQSLELFKCHAFRGVQPQGEYGQLAIEVVESAGGLPLTIKVLGSLLHSKKDVQKWKDTLEKVKKVPDRKVQDTLRISYDSLSKYVKEIFLDIACFFIGWGRPNATYMWEGLGWYPKSAIQVLVERSLITINEKSGEFEMHDQIRDMGREIVGGESSETPEKDTRFPRSRNFLDLSRRRIVGTEDVVEAIQVIREWDDPVSVDTGCFADMSRLRMLRMENVALNGEYERFPRNIRWLECSFRDLDCLPGCLHLDNMVLLNISRSSILQLWDGQKVLYQLKVLNLSYCWNLRVCPDFTSMPRLEILNLEYCTKMSELDPSIGHPKSLIELYLADCESLKELPEEIYELTTLQKLDLSACDKITALPRHSGDSRSSSEQHVLGKLQVLLLDDCISLTRCPDFIKMPNLETLSFENCEKMNKIDPSIGHLKRLIRLDLRECSSLKELPQEIGQSTSLKELELSYCSQISSLPESMGRLKQLNSLHLQGCSSLQEVPKSIGSLDQLETLSISYCELLQFLPPLPPSLIRLDASYCGQLESVGDISNVKGLKVLDLSDCERLLDVAGIEQSKSLEFLSLWGCRRLSDSILERIKDLDRLKELNLHGCESLTKSPHFTSNMTHLRYLDFSDCANMTEVDPSIRHLKALTRLKLRNCESLTELPEEVCQLTSLEVLDLENCFSLREVPESICLLLHLQRLDLSGTAIEHLPDSICLLLHLRRLDLSGTAIKQLPQSIIQLENLHSLFVRRCNNLEFLPKLPPSVTNLDVGGCGDLLDILGIEQLTGLEEFAVRGCIRLEDSLVESIFLNNEHLKRFSISRRLIEGGSSYPQSLSFPFPKGFRRATLYLYVDEISFNNIRSVLDKRYGFESMGSSGESDDSEQEEESDDFNNIRSVLDSQQEEESVIPVVRLLFSINDVRFLLSASVDYCLDYDDIPTARFSYEEAMKKVAEAYGDDEDAGLHRWLHLTPW